MGRNVSASFTLPFRSSPRGTCPILTASPLTREHPALSYPAEEDAVQFSLDLSYQQSIAISRLDRQLIDNRRTLKPSVPPVIPVKVLVA